MKSKPAKIRSAVAARCEAIAKVRCKELGVDCVTWSQVLHEAQLIGLKAIETRMAKSRLARR